MTGAPTRAYCNAAPSGSVTVCGVAALLVAVMAQPARQHYPVVVGQQGRVDAAPTQHGVVTAHLDRATAADIAFTRDAIFDLLKIRASSTLFPLAQG